MEIQDLQIVIVNSFPKGEYPIVCVHSVENNNSQKKTPNDKEGGSNPKWNFSIDVSAAKKNYLTLVVKLKAKRILRDDKDIGEILVPIKNLLDSYGESNDLKLVTQSSVAAITSTPGGYQDPSGIGGYPPQQSIGDKLAKGIYKWLCGIAKMAVCHAVLDGDLAFN
uniref:C2 domain-containing protein n=1 Tax=Fagus sylvatica TaxID=28930 RepID=A0A2N9FK32_FAGSY